MLSQNDRRALAEIEQQLRAQAPELAQLLEGFDRWAPTPPHHRIAHVATLAVMVLGAVLLALAFALHNAACLLLATMVLLPVLV